MDALSLVEALKWPGAIVFVVLILAFYHDGIKSLITRIRKVGKDGLEMESQTISAQQVEAPPKPPVAAEFESLLASSNKWVTARRYVEETRELFKKAGRSATDPTSCEALLSLIGMLVLYRDFDDTYNQIFGSQIALLKRTNNSRPGWDKNEAIQRYAHVQEKENELKKLEFDQYTHFLIARGLITIENDVIAITIKGTEFLTWMVEMGKKENRAF